MAWESGRILRTMVGRCSRSAGDPRRPTAAGIGRGSGAWSDQRAAQIRGERPGADGPRSWPGGSRRTWDRGCLALTSGWASAWRICGWPSADPDPDGVMVFGPDRGSYRPKPCWPSVDLRPWARSPVGDCGSTIRCRSRPPDGSPLDQAGIRRRLMPGLPGPRLSSTSSGCHRSATRPDFGIWTADAAGL